MRLFLLKVIYLGNILTSNQLQKVIKRNSNYIFHIYNTINKEFIKVYYSKDISKFVIEIDNGIYSEQILELGCKLQIDGIWNL